jgi:KipI family sensor histidine kinase inhibitor
MSEIGVRRAGDRGALLELPDNRAAVRAARALSSSGLFVEVVPGHQTVLVTWAVEPSHEETLALAERALAGSDDREPVRTVEIPVTYGGPDIADVAQLSGLSAEEVVARHLAPEYTVGFLGFAPGFAYLLGGDPALNVSRLDEPRTRVPAGSVALAGPYSGVYPRESPGGWRLLGSTALTLFDPARTPPALLAAGDRVRLVPA